MQHRQNETGENAAASAKTAKPLRRLLGRVFGVAIVVLILVAAGFVWFSANVLSARKPDLANIDAIIVLTGGSHRIEAGLELLDKGVGDRLLISGVNPSTSRESIRRVTGSDGSLFDCCVDVGYEALNTRGNASEAARWIRAHDYRRILIVTSSYHLPRSLFEMRTLDPETVYVGYPVDLDLEGSAWYANPRLLRLLATEYLKYIGAHIRVYAGVDRAMAMLANGR
ncbi:YdcF family protein [Martelella sp. HB161492]|uniref:ElyC/SanA/YdcF family protein n=1 Tax=Martelella sp. HB161492 TaxID=2720726 RepID=UPI0015925FDB